MASKAGALAQEAGRAESAENLMDKLSAEDNNQTSDFFRELISAAGLRSAWVDLLRRMRSLERQQAEIWEHASKEVLESAYITRPEYDDLVRQQHQVELEKHGAHLADLQTASDASQALGADHGKQLGCLHEKTDTHHRRMDGIAEHLDEVELQDKRQHETCLQLSSEAEERCASRESAIKEALQAVCRRLDDHDRAIEVLQKSLRRQQEFLESKQLHDHMTRVCSVLLQQYVPKTTMLTEVAGAAEFLVKPVRENLAELTEKVADTTTSLREVDAELRTSLTEAEDQASRFNKHCEDCFRQVHESLDLRATITWVEGLERKTRDNMASGEERMQQLKKETYDKMQELVDRVSEFQIILEDHEHCLHHHAEELLNRSTKYDLVVTQQRVDRCAIKEKVDNEFRELMSTVDWQTAQLEMLGYGKSFANASIVPSSRNTSRRPSRVELSGADGSEEDSTGMPSASGQPAPPVQPMLQAVQPFLAMHPQRSSRATTIEDLLGRNSTAVGPTGTEVYSLLRMQVESLGQGLVALARLTTRSGGGNLPREARQEREAELMHHLSCLQQWIAQRKAPFAWDPERLATLALRSMQGHGGGESAPPTARSAGTSASPGQGDKSQPLTLRRGKRRDVAGGGGGGCSAAGHAGDGARAATAPSSSAGAVVSMRTAGGRLFTRPMSVASQPTPRRPATSTSGTGPPPDLDLTAMGISATARRQAGGALQPGRKAASPLPGNRGTVGRSPTPENLLAVPPASQHLKFASTLPTEASSDPSSPVEMSPVSSTLPPLVSSTAAVVSTASMLSEEPQHEARFSSEAEEAVS